MKSLTPLVFCALALTLAGCAGKNKSQDDNPRRYTLADGTLVTATQLIDNPSQYRAFFSDTTVKSWNRWHGTQVEYHSADGQVWLVYPGNRKSVRGEWVVRTRWFKAQMCYRYQQNSYNPVTKQGGGRWECRDGIRALYADTMVDGDVLKLRGRGPYPKPLPAKINISLNTIKKAIGLGPLTKPNKVTH